MVAFSAMSFDDYVVMFGFRVLLSDEPDFDNCW